MSTASSIQFYVAEQLYPLINIFNTRRFCFESSLDDKKKGSIIIVGVC